MSHDQHQWEQALSGSLDRTAEGVEAGSGLGASAVIGRARSIRRRRRAAVVGGVAAVVAVVTPFAIAGADRVGADGLDPAGTPSVSTPASPEPTTATDPEQTPSPSETPPPGGVDAGTGDAPGVDYLEGRVLHRADGSQVRLAQRYQQAAWLGGPGDLVAAYGVDPSGASYVHVIFSNSVRSTSSTSGIVASEDSDAIAFIDADGTLMTNWAVDDPQTTGEAVLATGLDQAATVVGMTGGPNCFDPEGGPADADGCTVYVDDGSGTLTGYDSHGINASYDVGVGARDTRGRSATWTVDRGDFQYCTTYGELGLDPLVESCDLRLERISPTGDYVTAVPIESDGLGAASVSVVDRTGEVLSELTPPDGFVGDVTWEDDEHALAIVWSDGEWTMRRITGTAGDQGEIALGPVAGDEVEPPWRFAGAR